MRIVVVEDAPELILLTELLLKRESSFKVMTVGSDFEKLDEMFDWNKVDVALVDRFLGSEHDGVKILCWLKDAFPHVRRIMMTADYEIQAEEACAEIVLRKPVDATALVKAVRGD